MPTNPTSNKNKFSSFEEWFQWEIKHEDRSWKLVNNSTGEIHSGGDEALNEWIAYSREITPDEINPTKKHKATIIFLHGIELSKRAHPFNLTGENVKMLIPHPHIKYIFPQAPVNDWDLRDTYGASLGFTNKFTNWFNIRGLGRSLSITGRAIGEKEDSSDKETTLDILNSLSSQIRPDKEDLMNSFNHVNQIIQQEITNGVDPEKIIVFGFSQGGCLALASTLLLETKIGGFVANGSFLPFWENSIEELFVKAKNVNKKTPILICHGEADDFVPYWIGRKSADLLKENGWNKVEFKSNSFNHGYYGEEIQEFLEKHLLEEPKKEITKEEWIDKQTGWLRDIGLDKIYQLINQKRKINGKDVELFGNSFLLGNLMMRINDQDFTDRSLKGLIKRMDKSSFVFVPACWGNPGVHWSLFVYDKNTKIIHHYNSYESIDNLKNFLPLLKMERTFAEKIKETREHQTPQQKNGIDCGFYVCAITEFLVRRYRISGEMSWEINQEEVEEIKKNVLIFRKILEENNEDYFDNLSTETTQKSSDELAKVQQKTTGTQNVFNKSEVSKEGSKQTNNLWNCVIPLSLIGGLALIIMLLRLREQKGKSQTQRTKNSF